LYASRPISPCSSRRGAPTAGSTSRLRFRGRLDAAFDRVKAAGIPYGDSFHAVGNMQGPGDEEGSRGAGRAVYFFDPNRHLIEIRHYGE
jgi:catechol 2,3-dioxygenase-like lactoylglutathione lyase family enzyme